MIHELKIEPTYFRAVLAGKKLFEIRRDDRNFQLGDILILREYGFEGYTDDQLQMVVIYIMRDDRFLQPGCVAMSIAFKAGHS